MMKNKTIKNLLATDHNALKALHDVMHYDYNKPFNVFQIDGRFTVSKIEKMTAEKGYNPFKDTIVVLTIGGNGWRRNHLCNIKLQGGGMFDITFKFYSCHKTKIDSYITKGDFNETRKQDNITTFVICQKESDLAPKNEHKPDFANRFKVKSVSKWGYGNGGATYIGEVALIRTDDTGSIYTYNKQGNVYYRGSRPEYESIENIIDKSGYIVADKRRDLLHDAMALRAERAKAAYQATDNTAKLATLEKKIAEKKSEIVKALEAATTSEAIKAISKRLDYFHGLSDIVDTFERLTACDREKKLADNDAFTTRYNSILEKLNTI